ncbi:hypothetical protein JW933_09190 [candidate division FCPU426 bacterium]|nr:hypothetical protein [candidate division FCPU426 bacterium]
MPVSPAEGKKDGEMKGTKTDLLIRGMMAGMAWLLILSPVVGAEGRRIACGNSFLASAVADLFGEEAECVLLVQPREDAKKEPAPTADLRASLEQAELLLYHPFQAWILRVRDESQWKIPPCIPIHSRYNPALPGDYRQTLQEVQKIIIDHYPEYQTFLQERLPGLLEQLKQVETLSLARARSSKLVGMPCLSARSQKNFAEWMGCKVVETYGDTEMPTEDLLNHYRKKARQEGLWLVIGNRQGEGEEIAVNIAGAIQGQAVCLAGAPLLGKEGQTYSWQSLVEDNVNTLLQAVQWRQD